MAKATSSKAAPRRAKSAAPVATEAAVEREEPKPQYSFGLSQPGGHLVGAGFQVRRRVRLQRARPAGPLTRGRREEERRLDPNAGERHADRAPARRRRGAVPAARVRLPGLRGEVGDRTR